MAKRQTNDEIRREAHEKGRQAVLNSSNLSDARTILQRTVGDLYDEQNRLEDELSDINRRIDRTESVLCDLDDVDY